MCYSAAIEGKEIEFCHPEGACVVPCVVDECKAVATAKGMGKYMSDSSDPVAEYRCHVFEMPDYARSAHDKDDPFVLDPDVTERKRIESLDGLRIPYVPRLNFRPESRLSSYSCHMLVFTLVVER